MIEIKDVIPGKSYACKFRVETMLDTFDRPPGLSDTPLKGPGTYEGFGVIMTRDLEQGFVKIRDEESLYHFVVPISDIWDIDTVDWVEPK